MNSPAPRSRNAADVIVLGAGVIGASCAVHLARAGLRVILIDRGAGPGAGSTARATGGFRAQYEPPVDLWAAESGYKVTGFASASRFGSDVPR